VSHICVGFNWLGDSDFQGMASVVIRQNIDDDTIVNDGAIVKSSVWQAVKQLSVLAR
jgi:carbonic anhydrase/acetyltransferase-like protein (isoleucine patch superfamily)